MYNTCVEEKHFNILILGDSCVGKTSLVMQYTEGKFEDNYLLTVGKILLLKYVFSTKYFYIFKL